MLHSRCNFLPYVTPLFKIYTLYFFEVQFQYIWFISYQLYSCFRNKVFYTGDLKFVKSFILYLPPTRILPNLVTKLKFSKFGRVLFISKVEIPLFSFPKQIQKLTLRWRYFWKLKNQLIYWSFTNSRFRQKIIVSVSLFYQNLLEGLFYQRPKRFKK